jgi:septum formation protein
MNPAPEHRKLLLASKSPRRRRLLAWLGLAFEVAEVETPEELDHPLASDPAALAMHLAAEKGEAARQAGLTNNRLVLCFDTIVVHAGRVLGKPADADDAREMLSGLSGQVHQVVTGCALMCPGEQAPRTFAVVTHVRMKDLDDERIAQWMSSGEYMGCAGAYNIEGQVAEVTEDECYQNVAGLPLCHLYAELTGPKAPECLDLSPSPPVAPCDEALSRCCRLGPRVTGFRGCGA